MKNLIIVALIAVGGYIAWNNIPGLRDKVTQAADNLRSWDAEARKNDPMGFLEHASKQLSADITAFEDAKKGLDATKKKAEDTLASFRDDEANAKTLASTIKERYVAAEASGEWPVTVLGESYSRDKLMEQVEELLATQDNAAARQTEYLAVLEKIEMKRGELRTRINDSKAALDRLAAQKAMIEVDTLSTEADELLAQVNEVVTGNSGTVDDPVRSLEDLLKDASKAASAETKTESPSRALDFLNS